MDNSRIASASLPHPEQVRFRETEATGLNAGLRAWQAERRQITDEGDAAWQAAMEAWQAEREQRRTGTMPGLDPISDEALAVMQQALDFAREQKLALIAAGREAAAKRRTQERHQTPPWAKREAMQAIYAEAQRRTDVTGQLHHVDHVIPLRGRLVSGLHVETNLQVLHWRANLSKGARYLIESGPQTQPKRCGQIRKDCYDRPPKELARGHVSDR